MEDELDANGNPTGRKKNSSWLDYLPIPSFGTLLILLVIGIGGYFLGTTEKGKGWLSDLIEMLPEDWRGKAAGFLNMLGVEGVGGQYLIDEALKLTAVEAKEKMGDDIPKPIADIIAKDDATWKRVVGHVKEAGGNVLDPISDKVIYRLMLKEPTMVQEILRTLDVKGGSDTATRDKMIAAMKAIVADSTKLTTLFSAEHKANTFAALEILASKYVPFPAGNIGRFIEQAGLTNGAPNAFLKNFMGSMLGDAGLSEVAMISLIQQAPPSAVIALLKGLDASKIEDETLRGALGGLISFIGNSEKNVALLQQLIIALPEEKITTLMDAAKAGTHGPILELMKDKDIRTALQDFAKKVDLSAMPDAWKKSIGFLKTADDKQVNALVQIEQSLPAEQAGKSFTDTFKKMTGADGSKSAERVSAMVEFMTHQETRELVKKHLGPLGILAEGYSAQPGEDATLMKFLGTRDKATNKQAVNMRAVHSLFEDIAKNPDNAKNPRQARLVLKSMLGMLSGDEAAKTTLDVTALTAFFSSDANSNAFKRFLDTIEIYKLDPKHQAIVNTLRKSWGDKDHGIVEMIRDAETMAYLKKDGNGRRVKDLDGFERWAVDNLFTSVTSGVSGAPKKVIENIDDVGAIQEVLIAAGVLAVPTSKAPGSSGLQLAGAGTTKGYVK